METRAPAVVAVVVTTGSAPGLEATLSTLAGQDYEELSILVVATGGTEDVVARVAAVAPNAFVKVLEENRGFAAACNEASLMVTGAAFTLFCHDDVLFFEGAVRQLVESAFRNNAGIVTPKVVAYDDHYVLLHVGQVADRFGTVRERVELGEIDHGQQDLERDVFVAPGGATLIRTDLFETLRGFDPLIPALGEDLDICWRAQVAGARIVVAPAAVIAHRETLATGERPVSVIGTKSASRMDLARRHQLATVLTCWGPLHLALVVPLLLVMDLAEAVLSMMGRDTDRLGAILGSWRWVWSHQRHLRSQRRELNSVRVLKDSEIVRLQVGGAVRLKTFFTTLFQDGLDHARGMIPPEMETENTVAPDAVGFSVAFSEDESFDDIEGLDEPETHRRFSRLFAGARSQLVAIIVVAVIWLYGARNLVAAKLPIVGRLAPLDSWWTTWRHFFASWSVNGVGNGSPGMPGYAVLGFAGTFTFGRMGVLPRAALIFAIPLGAWGVWRLLRSVVSNRARLAGVVAYVAFPVGVNLVEQGRVDVLVVAAVLPFALRRILVLVGIAPFRIEPFPTGAKFGYRGWSQSRAGVTCALLLQVALMTAMSPAALVVVELVIVGLVLAHWLTPRSQNRLERPWGLAVGIAVGTALLVAPLTFDTVVAGRRALSVFGLALGPNAGLGLSAVLRGANGTFGHGWGAWLLPLVALTGFVLSRGVRHELAVRFASVLVIAVAAAVAVGSGWMGHFAPDVNDLMVLVGLMMAVLAAVAISALENDVVGANFGWRQVLAGVGAVAMVAVALPMLAQASTGRFNLPSTGTPESLGALAPSTLGGYRVLWLGSPNVLPLPGWSVAPGLAAATTTNGSPDGGTLFTPPNTGAADDLLNAVNDALNGRTVHLGQLLAPSGITTIVVMSSVAPNLSGLQTLPSIPPPANLLASLKHQSDLRMLPSSTDIEVFSNSLFHGIVAERTAPLAQGTTSSDADSAAGWVPTLDFGYRSGPVSAGTVLAGLSPSSAFALNVNGHDVARSGALGWAATYRTGAGTGTLVLHQLPLNGLLAAATLMLWVAFLIGFGFLEVLSRTPRGARRVTSSTPPVALEEVSE